MTKQLRRCPDCKALYLTNMAGGDEKPVLDNELVALMLAYGPVKDTCCFACLDDIIDNLIQGGWRPPQEVLNDNQLESLS